MIEDPRGFLYANQDKTSVLVHGLHLSDPPAVHTLADKMEEPNSSPCKQATTHLQIQVFLDVNACLVSTLPTSLTWSLLNTLKHSDIIISAIVLEWFHNEIITSRVYLFLHVQL